MTNLNRFFAPLLFTALLAAYAPLTRADIEQQSYGDLSYRAAPRVDKSTVPTTYGGKVGRKALWALANLTTAPLEIPKNIINTTNQGNIFYGLVGGLFKGIINTAGRLGVGVADLVTIPLPTRPIAYPIYIWQDFDVDTTYLEVFRLDETTAPTAKPAPAAQPTAAVPAVTPPSAPAVDRAYQYNNIGTNRTLDNYFKEEMKK